MTETNESQPAFTRQISYEIGWDNPFRPGGYLAREADEIVNMIKDGKTIAESIKNGKDVHNENYATWCEGSDFLTEPYKMQSTGNEKEPASVNSTNCRKNFEVNPKSHSQVTKQIIPGPKSASRVVIDEAKEKPRRCCVIQ